MLRSAGYEQISMRMFRRMGARGAGGTAPAQPDYTCQTDGMVGVGCGARSYTERLHWSTEFAVSARGVRAILDDYLDRVDFSRAEVGIRLDSEERRRRFVLLSLLQCEGLDIIAYRERFASDVTADFPQLDALAANGYVEFVGGRLRLTESGIEFSDAIGPWFYSRAVVKRMKSFDLR